jgi:hypothetical protein
MKPKKRVSGLKVEMGFDEAVRRSLLVKPEKPEKPVKQTTAKRKK